MYTGKERIKIQDTEKMERIKVREETGTDIIIMENRK